MKNPGKVRARTYGTKSPTDRNHCALLSKPNLYPLASMKSSAPDRLGNLVP